MTKKKLAFYDAFRQKPEDSAEQSADSSASSESSSASSKNLGNYSAYSPGEELTVRPRPKHVPTSHHQVSGQNVEIRAKGSSLAPGMAQKYQTPNVNRNYLPPETESFRAIPVIPKPGEIKPVNNPPLPTEETASEENLTENVIPQPPRQPSKIPSIPKAPAFMQNETIAKPISSESVTLPYLEPEDLETQKVKIPETPKKSPQPPLGFQKVPNSNVNPNMGTVGQDQVITITVPQALLAIVICLVGMVLSYVMGYSFHSENSSSLVDNKKTRETIANSQKDLGAISENKRIGVPIEPPKPAEIVEKSAPVEKEVKTYIILAATVSNMEQAKLLGQKLEANGFKPTALQKNAAGNVTITIGPFNKSTEANSMLKSLRLLQIKGRRPFETAQIK